LLLCEQDATLRLAASASATSLATAERMKRPLFRSSFHVLHARWQAGTLFAPTAEETAFFVEDAFPRLPAQMCGACLYILVAEGNVAQILLSSCTPEQAEAHLHAVYGALRVALETDARRMLERNTCTGQVWSASQAVDILNLKSALHSLVTAALADEASVVLGMRATCGLTAAEETALRQLAERQKAVAERYNQDVPKQLEDFFAIKQQAAAADAARHGLRCCALPACDAQEAHPKLFKLCGRCRGAAYCGAAHCAEDWKRHKREDSCKAAP
jgi:hypothetical protein